MCGIVGVAQTDQRQRYGLDDVRRMADAMIHRGPDDEGFHAAGPVILGMRRLSIIDLDGGQQPITNEDGTIWVVNNGEIYNFQALRRELQQAGHTFKTASDTEVLVHLYEELGVAFLERLEGMFGLALWDSNTQQLIVARDRVGIKPIYYRHDAGNLAFASEIKSLLALPDVHAAVNNQALLDYATVGYAVAPQTIFAGVNKLNPGTALIWQKGQMQLHRYWSPPTAVDDEPSYDDWLERVRAELERAVRSHMISDVPVGAFLSGGIDSSAVVALMAGEGGAPINTYSIGYGGSQVAEYYNELPYAKLVADRLGTRHREIEVQPNVAELLPKLIWHLEEPISDSAITTTYLVSALAAESVKVILSGVGGDELFAGYTRYLGDHYSRQYRRLPAWARGSLMPKLSRLLPSGRQNRFMDLSRYAKRFIAGDRMAWRDRYRYFLAIADDAVVDELLRNPVEKPDGFARIAANEPSSDELLRLMRIDGETQLAENLLLLTDKMSMAVSIECRVPFLDHRLLELAATIPARHKLPQGRLKGLLKDALQPVLPDDIINRRKRGFGAPVGDWFKRELAPIRDVLLHPATIERRGLLDPLTVKRLCAAHDSSQEDYTDLILVLMNLEIWSRQFLDGQSYADVAAELADRSKAA